MTSDTMRAFPDRILFFMPVFMAGMMLFSCHPGKNLSPEEAMKAIKVLNSDLTNLSAGMHENPAFYGLHFLLEEPTSPISTEKGLFGKWLNDTLSSAKTMTGIYTWDIDSSKFNKIGDSDFIEIRYPGMNSTLNNCQFLLRVFNCRPIDPGLCFPAELQATMTMNEEENLTISQKSVFKDDLPHHVEFLFSGKDFQGSIIVDRTRDGNKGTLNASINFEANRHQILSGNVHAVIGYNGSQFYYRTYEPDLTIFDVSISGKLDYGKVDPTSNDYLKSFNDNCHIGFFDAGNHKKIGDFGIGSLNNGELLGWVVTLSDGSPVFLEEYLLVLEKIFNYKLPN